MGNLVVVGGSRGLGAALCEGLADPNGASWVVSRTMPQFFTDGSHDYIQWIQADLVNPSSAATAVREAVGDRCVDTLIYCAGVWEKSTLDQVSEPQLLNIVAVNLSSAMTVTKSLLRNIRKSPNGSIILIGSTCGLENEGAAVSAYAATKFGLRGFASALRETLRKDFVRVVCVSPGSMATDLSFSEGVDRALEKYDAKRIPVGDIVSLLKCVINLSRASCVKEIVVPATADTDV